MRRELVGVTVRLGDHLESCETSIQAAGGYVVVVESLLAMRGVLLVSSYLAELNGRTAVSHLAVIGSAPAEFWQRMVERMPGQTHARACLLDHAASLRRALDDGSEEVSVEISDAALATAAGVWRNVDASKAFIAPVSASHSGQRCGYPPTAGRGPAPGHPTAARRYRRDAGRRANADRVPPARGPRPGHTVEHRPAAGRRLLRQAAGARGRHGARWLATALRARAGPGHRPPAPLNAGLA